MNSIKDIFCIENIKDFKFINKCFLISKSLIIILFFLLYYSNPEYFGNAFLNFDATHYYNIGVHGYTEYYQYAFFPLFPLIIKLFNTFGIPIIGAFIFNNIVHYLSTILIYKCFKDIYKNKDKTIYMVIILWLFSPTAFFSTILYSEPLFIFLALSSFYLYKKNKKLIFCGILLGLSVCTRNLGAILFFSIFIMLIINFINERDKENKKQLVKNAIKIYIPATLLSLSYPIYLFIYTGSWKTFIDVQYLVWHRIPSTFFEMTIVDISTISNTIGVVKIVNTLNFIILWVLIIFIACSLIRELIKKRLLKLDLILFLVGTFICATSTMRNDGIAPASCSVYRYLYSLFPLFLLIDDDTTIKWFLCFSVLFEIIVTLSYFFNVFLC